MNLKKCSICENINISIENSKLIYHTRFSILYVCSDCYSKFLEDVSIVNKLDLGCCFCGEDSSSDHIAVELYSRKAVYICSKCFKEKFSRCACCGGISLKSELNDNTGFCDMCVTNGSVIRCDSCGDYYLKDHTTKVAGRIYCNNCYNNIEFLFNYSYKPRPIFYGDDGKVTTDLNNLFLGVELEVDCGDYNRQLVRDISALCGGSFFYCKRDGSLEDDGFEIVTHPATLEFHMKHAPWTEVIRLCRSYGYLSDQTYTCGLHIHVNRTFFGNTEDEQDLHIAKLILLITQFWDDYIIPFSRRRSYNLDRWAKKFDTPVIYESDSEKCVSNKILDKVDESDRYQGINLQNSHTVEFRFFKGTLNIQTLFAAFQFTDRISRYAKRIKLSRVSASKWMSVFGIKSIPSELKDYLKLRNLYENKGKIIPVIKKKQIKDSAPSTIPKFWKF